MNLNIWTIERDLSPILRRSRYALSIEAQEALFIEVNRDLRQAVSDFCFEPSAAGSPVDLLGTCILEGKEASTIVLRCCIEIYDSS